jgi:hypothetical protein
MQLLETVFTLLLFVTIITHVPLIHVTEIPENVYMNLDHVTITTFVPKILATLKLVNVSLKMFLLVCVLHSQTTNVSMLFVIQLKELFKLLSPVTPLTNVLMHSVILTEVALNNQLFVNNLLVLELLMFVTAKLEHV